MTPTLRKISHRVEAMRKHLRGKLLLSEPMSQHVTLGIGGTADAFFLPIDKEDLTSCLRLCHDLVVPFMALGNGSNVLFRDGGFRGLIVSTAELSAIRKEGESENGARVILAVESGVLLSRLLNLCVEEALSGLEFTAGIPGTVGGAVMMNAGAHGSSLSDVVSWVELADLKGELHRFDREELAFDYRCSGLTEEGIITETGFSLKKGDEQRILSRVKWCLSERGKRLPFGWMNAGSIFKNPPGDYAGRLIEEMGFKGFKVGGAMVSEEHANVIINIGGAKARDVIAIMEEINRECRRRYNLALEAELKIVGEG